MKDLFHKILDGSISGVVLGQTDTSFALVDKYPIQEGHVLVVPKNMYENILDMPQEEYLALWADVYDLARTLKKAYNVPRVLFLVEGFLVPQVHIHLIPAHTPDALHATAREISLEQMQQVATKLSLAE
jgi:histidine triad (HIT) family protein